MSVEVFYFDFHVIVYSCVTVLLILDFTDSLFLSLDAFHRMP